MPCAAEAPFEGAAGRTGRGRILHRKAESLSAHCMIYNKSVGMRVAALTAVNIK
jgi:hypothetical protein